MRTIWNEQVYLKAPSKSQSRNTTNANKDDNKKAETAMSHDESPNTTATVHIDSAGEISIQCNQSVADVCNLLGLQGNGIGQCVGVRDPKIIQGKEHAHFANSVKIVCMNPPDVTINVAYQIDKDDPCSQWHANITVAVDDLVPLDTKVSTAKSDPLQLGYEPHMPRLAPFDFRANCITLITYALKTTEILLSSAMVTDVEERCGGSIHTCRWPGEWRWCHTMPGQAENIARNVAPVPAWRNIHSHGGWHREEQDGEIVRHKVLLHQSCGGFRKGPEGQSALECNISYVFGYEP